ncbi:MAG: galactose ABC transporter substrate-binding protein [Ruminococcaceae bacterium]|nr:galactose ABC transporter substrate-binding protein [Oscillospiraceae bacterium]
MRKITAALLAVFLLSAAGCSCGGSAGGQNTPGGDQAANSDRLSVDAFFYDYSDTYIGSVRSSMESLLKDEKDLFSYTFYDGASDQSTQTEQIETAVTRGSDLLVVNVVTTGSDEASQTIIQNASAQNIPVIFFNREVSDDIINSYENCLFVGTDADEAGYMQGQMIAEYLMTGDNAQRCDINGDKKIAYVMFRGELGNAEAYGRTRYSVENANLMLEQAGSDYRLTPSAANQYDPTQDDDGVSRYYLYGNWSATTAKNLMDTALTTYSLDNGDIEMVIANNDDQALGAIEAMNELGYNSGDQSRSIPVFGVDATSVAREAIQAGNMSGTIEQDARGMSEAILHFARNIAEGRQLKDGMEDFHVDEDVDKVRISYHIFTGDNSGTAASGTDTSGGDARSAGDGSPRVFSGHSGADGMGGVEGDYANDGRTGGASIGSADNANGGSDRIRSGKSGADAGNAASNSGSGSGGGIYNAQ